MAEHLRARDFFIGSFNLMKQFAGTFWKIVIPVMIFNIAFGFLVERQTASLQIALLSGGAFVAPLLIVFVSGLLSLVVSSALAVGWHRRTILGEEFRWSVNALIGSDVWGYLGRIILIALIVIAILIIPYGVVVFGALQQNSVLIGLGGIVLIVTLFFAIVYAQRLSIALPSRAIGEPIGFRTAAEATKGYFWLFFRLIVLVALLAIVISLPVIIIDVVRGVTTFDAAEALTAPPARGFVSVILSGIVNAVLAIYQVGLLTLLYLEFIKGDGRLRGDTSAL